MTFEIYYVGTVLQHNSYPDVMIRIDGIQAGGYTVFWLNKNTQGSLIANAVHDNFHVYTEPTPTILAADAWEAGRITTEQFQEISGGRMTLEEALTINAGVPVADPMAPIYIPPPDLCAGITCPNTCDGTSLYSRKCVNGHCVKDTLIESNSPTCGYIPPVVPPAPTVHIPFTIPSITIPSSSPKGEYVSAVVKTRNPNASNLPAVLKTYVNGVQIRSVRLTVLAGLTTNHASGFHMPDNNVVFTAKLYYGDNIESEMYTNVELEIPPDPCASASDISIVSWTLPSHGHPGDIIVPTLTLQNGSSNATTIRATVGGASIYGASITSGYVEHIVAAGTTLEISCPISIPTNAVHGTYTLYPDVYSTGTELLATGMAKIIVVQDCEHGDVKTDTCPDGSVVQTHVCIPPHWVATGVTCTTECKDGDTVGNTCPYGTYITLKRCVDGAWVDTGDTCPSDDTPDTGEPGDEPDNGAHDLMPGQTCVGSDLYQLITGGMIGDLIEANSSKCPSAPPEDEGIFGDLDTKWIIIAVIGIALLGLLS